MPDRPEFVDDDQDLGPDPAEAVIDTAPPVVEDEPAPEPDPEPDMFPRDYVEELRREAAEWRTKYQGYNQRFDGYTEDEREALLDYMFHARRAEAGDPESIQWLNEMFGPDDDPGIPDQAPQPQFDEETFRQLAREEAARLVAEQQAQAAQVQAVQTVQSRAQELGYEVGSGDYILLLKYANEVDADDPIQAGHDKVQAYKQQIIQQHLASIQAQNDQVPTIPRGGSQAPSQAQAPRTFAEARQAMHERLTRELG